eukprot:Nitzschia sp. Nitz4//scaffold15_size197535//157602//158744//NITZ4_001600-RA/size197535-processed-gene-0.29-mRNA-1//1//CDS//3329537781//5735//frame0
MQPPTKFLGLPTPTGPQKVMWNLEQDVVAAVLEVQEDPPVDRSSIPDNPFFHLIRDNHRDVFSFSSEPELYGGVDVSFPPNPDSSDAGATGNAKDNTARSAVAVYVVIDRRTMKTVYRNHVHFILDVPYVPTYLAFREIKPLERLVQQQIHLHPQFTPRAILVDGNGILHPRNAGIACFLGTRTGIPTIGVGKTLLYEAGWTRESVDRELDQFLHQVHKTVDHQPPPWTLGAELAKHRGLILKKTGSMHPQWIPESPDSSSDEGSRSWSRKDALEALGPYCNGVAIPLEQPASVLASKEGRAFPVLGYALVGHGGEAGRPSAKITGSSKPIFVSVGHKISHQRAVQVAAFLSLSRIPEPIRQADLYGRELMRQAASSSFQ